MFDVFVCNDVILFVMFFLFWLYLVCCFCLCVWLVGVVRWVCVVLVSCNCLILLF